MPRLLLLLLTTTTLIVGCTNLRDYDITLNERPLYSPDSLFGDYRITDQALATCIEQMIEDGYRQTNAFLASTPWNERIESVRSVAPAPRKRSGRGTAGLAGISSHGKRQRRGSWESAERGASLRPRTGGRVNTGSPS